MAQATAQATENAVGRVVQVIGPVIDVEFANAAIQEI
jgi:F0F1-type ATP synthase beta subunit